MARIDMDTMRQLGLVSGDIIQIMAATERPQWCGRHTQKTAASA